MFDDADEAIAQVREDIERAQQRAERIPHLVAATAQSRGSAASAEGDIVVEMDHTGMVTSLRIEDKAFQRGGQGVAIELVSLMNQARLEVRRRMLASAVEIMGEDDPIVKTYRTELDAETLTDGDGEPPTGSHR